MRSCIYTGHVRHQRRHPKSHDFHYHMLMMYLDLDELDQVAKTITPFSLNQWNVWSFFDRDHIDGRAGPTRKKVERFLAHHGIVLNGGRVGLLTQCRVVGYVFNPISLFYCHDHRGGLAAVVVEVHNTFGERHLYLLHQTGDPGAAVARFQATKAMHVSPFIGMDCTYDFRLAQLGAKLSVGIELRQGGQVLLQAHLTGNRLPLTNAMAWRVLARYPWATIRTIAAIYVEAARLYLKGTPVARHPGATGAQLRQTALLDHLSPGTHPTAPDRNPSGPR